VQTPTWDLDGIRAEGGRRGGPNGGFIFCMEYLESNLDWLEVEIAKLGGRAPHPPVHPTPVKGRTLGLGNSFFWPDPRGGCSS